jgi:hypothetical protein
VDWVCQEQTKHRWEDPSSALGEWSRAASSGGTPLNSREEKLVQSAIQRLLNSKDQVCRQVGISASARLAAGGYYTVRANFIAGTVGNPLRGNVYLASDLFNPRVGQKYLVNTVAHEEFHYFEPATMIPWNDTRGNAVYNVGDQCAR